MRAPLLRFAALWGLLQVAACESQGPIDPEQQQGGGGPPKVAPEKISITSVEGVRPGAQATLRGTSLDQVKKLVVDGHLVSFRATSASELQFAVPEGRTCETDGRKLAVVANDSVQAEGTMQVEGVNLQVGESRILRPEELRCLSLGAGDAAYVLSLHNFARDPRMDTPFRLRTYTSKSDTMAVSPAFSARRSARYSVGASAGMESFAPDVQLPEGLRASRQASGTPARVFDSRYATAQVGDTLRFVDWTDSYSVSARRREDVPTYPAVVIAATASQLIVADLRSVRAEDFLKPDMRTKLQRAAEIADRYQRAAIRSVLDPAFEFPQGAGGRQVAFLRPLSAGTMGTFGGHDLLGAGYSPWTSDLIASSLSSSIVQQPYITAERIAGTLIHENAHGADFLLGRARGRERGSAGWYQEAVAVRVMEAAARLALGREAQAPSVGESAPAGVPYFYLERWPSATSHLHPLAGAAGSTNGVPRQGAYDRGARILLFAEERLGTAGFRPGSETLHQRLLAKNTWGLEAIAEVVGLSVEELLARSGVAEITDDLVSEVVARERGLPQVASWDNTGVSLERRALLGESLSVDQAQSIPASVPSGAHNHWFIQTRAGRGLSVQARENQAQPHHQVRLTRLR